VNSACCDVNLQRLWSAEAVESFDFDAFNTGDYYGAVSCSNLSFRWISAQFAGS
jgi:hypothetical protein